MTNRVIFFDGYCVLCNSSVDFLISRDKRDNFRFASLQSDKAAKILSEFDIDPNILANPDTVIYLRNGDLKFKSDAAIHIISDLGGVFSLFKSLILLPKSLRDSAYNLVARKRYSLFGKNESCRIPKREEKHKFIE